MKRSTLFAALFAIAVGFLTASNARAEDDRIADIIRVLQKHADKMDATNRRLDSLEQRQAAMTRSNTIILENHTPEAQTITINSQNFRVPAFGTMSLSAGAGTIKFRWANATGGWDRLTLHENDEQRITLTDSDD